MPIVASITMLRSVLAQLDRRFGDTAGALEAKLSVCGLIAKMRSRTTSWRGSLRDCATLEPASDQVQIVACVAGITPKKAREWVGQTDRGRNEIFRQAGGQQDES